MIVQLCTFIEWVFKGILQRVVLKISTKLKRCERFVKVQCSLFQDVLSRPAEEFGNDETLERLWAAKAMEHSDIYFNVSTLFISSMT